MSLKCFKGSFYITFEYHSLFFSMLFLKTHLQKGKQEEEESDLSPSFVLKEKLGLFLPC